MDVEFFCCLWDDFGFEVIGYGVVLFEEFGEYVFFEDVDVYGCNVGFFFCFFVGEF